MKSAIIIFCTIILPLLIIAAGVYISSRHAGAADKRESTELDSVDPHIITSARGETHRARYPEEQRGF